MKKIGTIFTTATFLFVMAIASVSATAADTAADTAQQDSMAGTEKGKDSASAPHKHTHADHKEPKREYNNDE
jgi:hypothetical protein